jgi:glutathione S-transferase
MIKIWGRRSSSNVQAVIWCLEILQLPYERVDAGFTYGVVDTPEYLALNPNGTVPTIAVEGMPALWESGAIMRYLCNSHGNTDFWPPDPQQRAQVDQWAEWSKINIALAFTSPVFWKVVRTAPSKQDPVAIAAALDALHVKLAIADGQLADHQYLAGEHLTLADVQFGHVLYRYFDIEIERAVLPNVERYYEMLCDRGDYQRSVMVCYEELRVVD